MLATCLHNGVDFDNTFYVEMSYIFNEEDASSMTLTPGMS